MENKIIDKEKNRMVYEFQNMKFQLKKRNLKVREDTMFLLKDFQNFAKDWIQEYEEELINIEDQESKKYKYLNKKMMAAYSDAMFVYFSNESRCKNLFEKVLDGDVNNINYDCEDDLKYAQLLEFALKVFTDFFLNTLQMQK